MSQSDTADPVVSFDAITAKRVGWIRRYLRQHPVFVAVGTSAVYLFLSLLSFVPAAYISDFNPVGVLLLMLAVGVALLWRNRAPMSVLVIVFVLDCAGMVLAGNDASYSGVGMIIALYSVGTNYSGKRSIPLAVLAAAFQLLLLLVIGYPGTSGLVFEDGTTVDDYGGQALFLGVAGGLLATVYLTAAIIGLNVRNSRIHEAELNHWASQVSRLAQVQERNRIAREMHDVVAHSLSVMIALSDGARVVGRKDAARAESVLSELSGTGRAALADMRRMLGVLRNTEGGELAPQPTEGSMAQMLEGFRVAGLPLTYTYTGEPLPEDAAFQLTVHRIVQESLTNALRYARNVTAVSVRLDRDRQALRIEVVDNGQGIGGPSAGSGQGLRGMRERAALFGGGVNAGPGAHGGWIVKACLQLPDTDAPQRTTPKEESQWNK